MVTMKGDIWDFFDKLLELDLKFLSFLVKNLAILTVQLSPVVFFYLILGVYVNDLYASQGFEKASLFLGMIAILSFSFSPKIQVLQNSVSEAKKGGGY
jgi:hypothetical protein